MGLEVQEVHLMPAHQPSSVVVLCSSSAAIKRKLLLLAHDLDMTTDEYVYILSDLGASGYSECNTLQLFLNRDLERGVICTAAREGIHM